MSNQTYPAFWQAFAAQLVETYHLTVRPGAAEGGTGWDVISPNGAVWLGQRSTGWAESVVMAVNCFIRDAVGHCNEAEHG